MEQTQANVPLETVAVIVAALAAYLDQPVENVVLKSVTPEPAGRAMGSIWAKAGVLESHLARRQFGIRSR